MSSIPISKRKIKKNIIFRIINRIMREIEWYLINSNRYKRRIKTKFPINTPGEVIWCNTNLINYIIFNYGDIYPLEKFSSSENGNWDKKFSNIEDLNIYKAFYELIINNKSLKETKFYNPNIKNRSDWEKNSIWEYISEYDFEKRSNKIKKLINDIKTNGYKTQTELGGNPKNEIIVKIGRNGEIFFFDGIHRFCIAKMLGIKKIPVIVKTRHSEWIDFKKKLYRYALLQQKGSIHEGKLYQKPSHPDLQDIPYLHGNEDRLTAILDNIISKNGTVLDIGANLGFFSINLSMLGYKCEAAEQNRQLVYFLQKFNQKLKTPVKITHGNILSIIDSPTKYDVVLALNIFHHFIKTESSYNMFIKLLKNLEMKEMFFFFYNSDENQVKNIYKNLSNEEFIKLIIDNTKLKNFRKILDCYEDRYLYHLWH